MWNPTQYLQFGDERTQPCRDLAHGVHLAKPGTIVDLGCGPGNSTEVLRKRWPEAQLTGLDNSREMLAKAQASNLAARWVFADIGEWAKETETFDLVFSNAALHWLLGHETLFPRLLERCTGALAVQMPANTEGPAYRLIREMASSPAWNGALGSVPLWQAREVSFYYDLLAPRAAHLDLWTTQYIHVLPDAEAIVEWYKGSGLRPYLDSLPTEADRRRFLAQYLDGVRQDFKPQADGRVLFPFQRVFLIAYR
jgi:trans-aconitate 2-methyltransferase